MKSHILVMSFILFVSSLFAFHRIDQNYKVPDGILAAIKKGSAKELSAYFNASVELVILDKEDVYSKTQAELILKEFFTKHPPTQFTIIHEGGDKSKYAIGTLQTTNGTFRIYFLLKEKEGAVSIHQLRIEKEDE